MKDNLLKDIINNFLYKKDNDFYRLLWTGRKLNINHNILLKHLSPFLNNNQLLDIYNNFWYFPRNNILVYIKRKIDLIHLYFLLYKLNNYHNIL